MLSSQCNFHVTSRPVSFPPHPIPGGMLWHFFRITPPQRRAAMHLGYTWYIGKTFLQIHMHLHQLLILKNWIHGGKSLRNRFTCLQRRRVNDQNKIEIWDASLDHQPKIQSSSVEETLQRIMEQTNNDCRFRISILTSFLTPATFACWKMRFKTEVCTCSQFPTEAMQWIKEVELVDSVDELRFSSSIRGINAKIWSTWCEDCFSTE